MCLTETAVRHLPVGRTVIDSRGVDVLPLPGLPALRCWEAREAPPTDQCFRPLPSARLRNRVKVCMGRIDSEASFQAIPSRRRKAMVRVGGNAIRVLIVFRGY